MACDKYGQNLLFLNQQSLFKRFNPLILLEQAHIDVTFSQTLLLNCFSLKLEEYYY